MLNNPLSKLSNQQLASKASKSLMSHIELAGLREEIMRRIESIDLLQSENESLSLQVKSLLIQLEESEKNKSEFLSNIKNQLNNPLGSILLLSQHLMNKLDGPELSLMNMINNDALVLDFQLRNLMIAGELEAGESDLEVSCIVVKELVEESLSIFSNRILEKQLNVKVECDDEIKINTDRRKLAIAVQNLISNAIEFNKEKGNLSIAVSAGNDLLTINIEDEGIGFSKNEANLIFLRFKQLQSLPSRPHVSSGLGLCLVKDLVELLGGEIKFNSLPKKGSIFTLIMPYKIEVNTLEMDQSGIFLEM